jgi:MFS family permease
MKFKWLNSGLLLLFLGSFAVYVNLHLAFIVMPLYVLELGGNEWTAAGYNALLAGSAVATRFFLASWVDRFGRRFCLLLGGAALVTAPLFILLIDSLALLALVRLVQGFGLALYPLTGNTLVADLSPDVRRGTALGLMRLIIIAALVTGPPAASLIIEWHNFQTLFLLLGIVGIVGITPLLAIREPVYAYSRVSTMSSFLSALSSRLLRILFSATAACGLAYGVLITFLPLYAAQVGIENFGLFFTVFALSGLLSGVIAGRLSDALGREAVLLPALFFYGLGVISLSVLAPGTAMVVGAAVVGIGYSAALTMLVAWVVDEAGRELRAVSLGLFESGIDVGIAVGSFTFGTVIALAGYAVGFAMTGLLVLLFVLVIATVGRGVVPKVR